MAIKRELFSEDHDLFREAVRRFLQREAEPNRERWEEQGAFDHAVFAAAGAVGILCPTVPEMYGGPGADPLYSAIVLEEAAPLSNFGLALTMHSEIVTNYILHFGSELLKQRYLPRMVSGDWVGALAMTEPAAGSDLKALRTSALHDGEHYILNGSKTFISNGTVCDFAIVAAKTDPNAVAKGLSLLIVDMNLPGVSRGPPLKKIGLKSQIPANSSSLTYAFRLRRSWARLIKASLI